ncbi:polymorphic toxin-type HINT domain-containing protein [Stieleria maiorica]|nr:polymorphic toxin-type HINT domain-containing protein [Stieleria maiorica]
MFGAPERRPQHLKEAAASDNAEQLVSLSSARPMPTAHPLVGTRPIEEICVGDRVLAHNPEVSDEERASWSEPDWNDWLQLSLVMPKEDGSELTIELLRSEDWVRSQINFIVDEKEDASTEVAFPKVPTIDIGQAELSVPLSPLRPIFRDLAITDFVIADAGLELVGLAAEMDLPELAITGPAVIVDLRPAPQVQPGTGRVVTATFHHSSGDVIDLTIGDQVSTETIGTTSNHPFWSADRAEYVQAATLEIGEQVQTHAGDTKQVVSKLPRPGPQAVFNLEVHGEHVYYVGDRGVLVHNTQRYNGTGAFGRDPAAKVGISAERAAEIRSNARLMLRYVKEIEAHTGFRLGRKQRKEIIKHFRENGDEIQFLSPEATEAHRWTNSQLRSLRKRWARETQQTWPTYTQTEIDTVPNMNDARKVGWHYDAHEYIPNQFNAPHQWWNLVPARFPDRHQGGIHGTGAAYGEIVDRFGG